MRVSSTVKSKTNTVRAIAALLRATYGEPASREYCDPLDVLVQTILSQNTSDTNSHRAYENLRMRFRTWDAILHARVSEVESAIVVGGLAKTKARRIRDIIREIHAERGEVSLRFLCGMPPDRASEILHRFHGVGPKTVCCVLLFGCGMDVFPVDTHILRISKRLGLFGEKTTLERAHQLWAEFLPAGLAYPLHLNLIEHGRKICRARNPACSNCCISGHCAYFHFTSA